VNNYECGCERGDNCTKTSMCAIQSALEDQSGDYEEKIERLTAVVSGLRGLVRAVASETSIPMEKIEQSIDAASDKQCQHKGIIVGNVCVDCNTLITDAMYEAMRATADDRQVLPAPVESDKFTREEAKTAVKAVTDRNSTS